jgi:hypothetical protein
MSLALLVYKILMGNSRVESIEEFIPTLPLDPTALAQRVNGLATYLILWRQTVMNMRKGEETVPIVHVPWKDRARFGLDRDTVSAQMKRLVKAGLIEIVDRDPGCSTRVRLTKFPRPVAGTEDNQP